MSLIMDNFVGLKQNLNLKHNLEKQKFLIKNMALINIFVAFCYDCELREAGNCDNCNRNNICLLTRSSYICLC